MCGDSSDAEVTAGVPPQSVPEDRKNDGSEVGGRRVVVPPSDWYDGWRGVMANRGIHTDMEGQYNVASDLPENLWAVQWGGKDALI